jgi:hypothetical protein
MMETLLRPLQGSRRGLLRAKDFEQHIVKDFAMSLSSFGNGPLGFLVMSVYYPEEGRQYWGRLTIIGADGLAKTDWAHDGLGEFPGRRGLMRIVKDFAAWYAYLHKPVRILGYNSKDVFKPGHPGIVFVINHHFSYFENKGWTRNEELISKISMLNKSE